MMSNGSGAQRKLSPGMCCAGRRNPLSTAGDVCGDPQADSTRSNSTRSVRSDPRAPNPATNFRTQASLNCPASHISRPSSALPSWQRLLPTPGSSSFKFILRPNHGHQVLVTRHTLIPIFEPSALFLSAL